MCNQRVSLDHGLCLWLGAVSWDACVLSVPSCRGPVSAMLHAEAVFSAVEGQLEQKAGSPEVARGVYSQREAFLAKREAEGELTFRYVENDGAPDNSIWYACSILSRSCKAAAAAMCITLLGSSLHSAASSQVLSSQLSSVSRHVPDAKHRTGQRSQHFDNCACSQGLHNMLAGWSV